MRLPLAYLPVSVNFGFRRRRRAFEDTEIAAFVCLRDVVLEDGAEPALVLRLRPAPLAAASEQLRFAYLQFKSAASNVELDQIAIVDQCKRAAGE